MKIAVAGIGYVGLSNASILAQKHQVTLIDIDAKKITQVNNRRPPMDDTGLANFFKTKTLDLTATDDPTVAYTEAELIIIATPTNYDEATHYFDTSSVDEVISVVRKINPSVTIVIKSTVPVGFTEEVRKRYKTKDILFSPEFLREGKALYDNLHPSRIIVGDTTDKAMQFANLLQESAVKKDIPVYLMPPREAEAVKLFANTYLAMRIAFFNELDTYAELHGLSTAEIIKGISSDPRIGDYYNNPSFGYGGYCLPKDTKQLLANYQDIPNNLIQAIVDSNATRIRHVSDTIISRHPKTAGIYSLAMKTGSDNFRQSAILEVVEHLSSVGIEVIIYEPTLTDTTYQVRGIKHQIVNDLTLFKKKADIIIANRFTSELRDVKDKLYSRDLFNKD